MYTKVYSNEILSIENAHTSRDRSDDLPHFSPRSSTRLRKQRDSILSTVMYYYHSLCATLPLSTVSLSTQSVLVFAMAKTRMSFAPIAVNLSMAVAICLFSTIELTATQSWAPAPSKALMVGALLPGVIVIASVKLDLLMLYWHRTYF